MIDSTLGPETRLRQAYEEYDRQLRIHNLKLGCLLTAVLMCAGSGLDYMIYPAFLLPFFKLRLWVVLLSGILWLFLRFPRTQIYHRLIGLVLPLLPIGFIVWMIFMTEGAHSPYWAGLNLVLMSVALIVPWTGWESLVVVLVTIILYALACFYRGDPITSGAFFNSFYFLVTTGAVVVLGSDFSHRLRKRDFTSRFELDRNRKILEQNNRKLVELDQAKGRFFANISHELRTPLTLLIAPLEALRSDPTAVSTPQNRQLLEAMEQNAMRLLKLINDLLDLVRLEEGRIPLRWAETDLSDFLSGLTRTLSKAAQDRKIDLRSAVPYDLGKRWVDPDKLERIALNLLFNALKFTPAGGRVTLSASMEGDTLLLEVADTGIGIAPEHIPHVFDRFWQADDGSRRRRGGTGIGLALVKEMAEAHGGKASVASKPGEGSIFSVRLPASTSPPEGSSAAHPAVSSDPSTTPDQPPSEWLTHLYRRAELYPARESRAESESPVDNGGLIPFQSQKSRILLVDDEPDIRRFLKSQLSQRFEVLEAGDGLQALAMARQYLPDLILLDMMMPEKDGLQVLTELREAEDTRTLPVVLLTARADEDTKVKSLSAGADDFLTKPFSVTELHLKVQNLVNARELSKTLQKQNQRLTGALEQIQETEAMLVQSEKLNALGQLSAGLIHEINNPLNYALSAVFLMKGTAADLPADRRAVFSERLSDVEDGLQRVQRLIADLRGFTHKHSGSMELLSLESCVQTALRFFSHHFNGEVKCRTEIPPDLEVHGNSNQIVQVLINLIQNALDAQAGRADAFVELKAARVGARIRLSVADNGPGIPETARTKVFEPFFTTKEVGRGLGLGLSICHRLMDGMGGHVLLDSMPGHGARFTLDWPAVETAATGEEHHANAV